MGVNTVQLFCDILQEMHPKCYLEFVLSIMISGVALNLNPLSP